jgi:uncharacterized protein (DUF1778 family)
MSPRTGRPLINDTKKTERLEIRLTKEEKQLLTELSSKLKLSRAEVIILAIKKLAEQN